MEIKKILLLILLVSCKSPAITSEQVTLESIVAEKLGENAVIKKNSDLTFALCSKENRSTLSVAYLIIRLSDLAVVEQDNVHQSSVSWIDTYKAEIKTIPGIIKKDEPPLRGKIVDVTKHTTKSSH